MFEAVSGFEGLVRNCAKRHRCAWAVMTRKHAGSGLWGVVSCPFGWEEGLAQDGLKGFWEERAGAKEARVLAAKIDDRGFQSMNTGAAVEDEVDAFTERVGNVCGAGGADVGKRVCTGSGEGEAARFK